MASRNDTPQERYAKCSDAELQRLNAVAEEQAEHSDDETVNRIAYESRMEIQRRCFAKVAADIDADPTCHNLIPAR